LLSEEWPWPSGGTIRNAQRLAAYGSSVLRACRGDLLRLKWQDELVARNKTQGSAV